MRGCWCGVVAPVPASLQMGHKAYVRFAFNLHCVAQGISTCLLHLAPHCHSFEFTHVFVFVMVVCSYKLTSARFMDMLDELRSLVDYSTTITRDGVKSLLRRLLWTDNLDFNSLTLEEQAVVRKVQKCGLVTIVDNR